MKPGQKVRETISKKGQALLIRYIKQGDERIMAPYINKISRERSFILKQGEQITMKKEREFVEEQVQRMKNKEGLALLAFFGKTLIGVTNLTVKPLAAKHVGDFGISIAKEARGEGIGKIILQELLAETKKELKAVKIMTLEVFANNPVAIALYKKLGFRKYGCLPNGIKHRGKYVDAILMYKNIYN
ncbi:MAG: hypothetical protein A3F54_04455 [Candidatus Kerfeldbacteria bacterium RIFCSPHIGHO2_12_FULL_48_17]|uniref:N-acetyltransferase domain-containing protein n=1 Tax=Candidatus Kerfeldbacteria bacterium RIFCSPHIGHO2_12_FULL_48_17 TaxID=1798542 RepID=A0A1G2B1I4_9BACT|nr:MAG: hypothetical protein A3F54_04455 [Candidatus Kerfeldbacteria bacterium RIFCSPHIGHO2_12_FULL_48_17]